jgi:hypothetical protein
MSDKIKNEEAQDLNVEAEFTDDSQASTISAQEPVVEAQQLKPMLIQNMNNQYQIVTQDQTTINNIFRSESKGAEDFFKKILIELLLSIVEPDRFLKNAKAIAFLTIAYAVLQIPIPQLVNLIELYLSKSH